MIYLVIYIADNLPEFEDYDFLYFDTEKDDLTYAKQIL